ncbi:hypothetical protein BDN72DRAFT_849802 [Pluteus cervinus]|uniref:Uncharacterized protein n=1 Tax=Pluteus cervinus TaxID=181527 RepID=A0ACD3A925_9AGAR|nr:hypothetical protein BDN72DRAFT_849802 [Pluteus cervinus]
MSFPRSTRSKSLELLESQGKLDQEIWALEKRLSALRKSRNALALINQLPAEIFVEIFLWLQTLYIELGPGKILEWILATHTSQHWRSLALGSKTLWTIIPAHHIPYAHLASPLSYPVQVSIIGEPISSSSEKIGDEALGIFVPLLQRARKVAAMHSTGSFFARVLQSTPSEFPYLQDIDFNDVDVPLKESPFPPSLKRLQLSRSAFKWGWLKLEHLTELHLCYTSLTTRVTVDTFLSYMLQIPKLSYLEIRWVFEKRVDTSYPRRLPMFKLQHLVVQDSLSLVSSLLSRIKFKDDFVLQAEIYVDDENPDTIQAFFRRVDRHLQASQRVICSGSLIFANEGDLVLSCFDQEDATPFLVIEVQDVNEETLPVLLDWMQSLPFDKMERLSTDLFRDETGWRGCRFRHLKFLQELVVCTRASSHALLNFLAAEMVLTKRSHDWKSLSFPKTKFTLHDVRYSQVAKQSMAIFTGRAEHGFKVEELVFEGGNIADNGVKKLCRVVDKVTVT